MYGFDACDVGTVDDFCGASGDSGASSAATGASIGTFSGAIISCDCCGGCGMKSDPKSLIEPSISNNKLEQIVCRLRLIEPGFNRFKVSCKCCKQTI